MRILYIYVLAVVAIFSTACTDCAKIEGMLQQVENLAQQQLVQAATADSAADLAVQDSAAQPTLDLGFAVRDLRSGCSGALMGDVQFPMQSVYKLPIGVAVLRAVQRSEISLTDSITASGDELYADMWSPLSERHPTGFTASIAELLLYMVAHSDNLATDLLLAKLGSTTVVMNELQTPGFSGIGVHNTERELKSDWALQFQNSTSPTDMLQFLVALEAGELLDTEMTAHMLDVMADSSTGSIRRYVPGNEAIMMYKTGYSGPGPDGRIAAQNVVGIVEFEDSRRVAFCVLLSNSTIGEDAGYQLIAEIGRAIFNSLR